MAIETRYARNGDVSIAYQSIGQGSFDLVFIPGFISNLELHWEDPGYSRLLRRLSAFCRLIQIDKRGTGLSDRVSLDRLPDLATRMEDVRAVMDAAGSGRAALLGASDGAAISILFAATYPERTRALVLHGGYAHHDSWVPTRAALGGFVTAIQSHWGAGATLAGLAPGRMADMQFRQWWARFERLSASPSAAVALARMNAAIDVRGILGQVRSPTLVIHRADDCCVDPDASRYLARHIPGARLVELRGNDHAIWSGDTARLVDIVEEFLTGALPSPQTDRILAALLSGRIIGPERMAARLGDSEWRERLARFHGLADDICRKHGGKIWSWDGARISAHFDGPAKAVRAAIGLRDAVAAMGFGFAQGAHVGEVEMAGESVAGLAVHIADRIADGAADRDILVSTLLAELTAGSGLHFVDRPQTASSAVPGQIRLAAVATEQHLEPVARRAKEPDLAMLSTREHEVVLLVAGGLSNASIAAELRLSEHTVKRHVANILLKLDLPTRAAVAALSARQPAAR